MVIDNIKNSDHKNCFLLNFIFYKVFRVEVFPIDFTSFCLLKLNDVKLGSIVFSYKIDIYFSSFVFRRAVFIQLNVRVVCVYLLTTPFV